MGQDDLCEPLLEAAGINGHPHRSCMFRCVFLRVFVISVPALIVAQWLLGPDDNGVVPDSFLQSVVDHHCYLITLNVLTFIVFGVDKLLAIDHMLRVPECVLLALCSMFGWIGGFMAMISLSHKVRKLSFLLWMIVCLVLQICLVVSAQNYDERVFFMMKREDNYGYAGWRSF